jgi:hypothetical protein
VGQVRARAEQVLAAVGMRVLTHDALDPVGTGVRRAHVMAITPAPILAARGRALNVLAATLVALGRLAIDRVLIRVVAIPTPLGRRADRDGLDLTGDGRRLVRDVVGRALRVRVALAVVTVSDVVLVAMALLADLALTVVPVAIVPAPRVAARPPIPDL